MAQSATLRIDVVTDATQTTRALDDVESSLRATDRVMDQTGRSASHMGDQFGEVGSTSSQVAGGLGDLGGAMSEVGGPIGALGTSMEALGPSIMGVTGAMDLMEVASTKLKLAQIKTAAATLKNKIVTVATSAATKAMALAQAALNVVMNANPILLVVTALIAIGAALVLAYKKSETFRRIVNAAFAYIVAAARALWNGITTAFHAIVNAVQATGRAIRTAFDAVVGFFRKLPGWIGSALSGLASIIIAPYRLAWEFIRDHVFKPIRVAFDGVVDGITEALSGVFEAIISPFKAAWLWIQHNIVDPIKSVWNAVADAINSIHFRVEVPDWVPIIGGDGFTFDPPDVPRLAKGGVFDAATLAVVGEAGREVVTPERLMRRIVREEAGGTVNITVTGALDPDAVARQIEALLRRRSRRVGGVGGTTIAAAVR